MKRKGRREEQKRKRKGRGKISSVKETRVSNGK
jgi:hypothetical protein